MSKRSVDEEDPDVLEQQHFQHVVDAFMFYRTSSQRQAERKMKSLQKISQQHYDMIPTLSDRLKDMIIAIDVNYEFIKKIVGFTEGMFTNSSLQAGVTRGQATPLSGDDLDRVRTTLRQCVRDWAEEGKTEREKCYTPILKELEELFPSDLFNRSSVSVLVPGAGLGRLMFEIANNGFTCQGNEFSLYMLFASNYILNMTYETECITIHPWIHQTCNVVGSNDQLREVKIPDVNPSCVGPNSTFSMAAGDFLEVYTEPNVWDCVAMCFFLDTAHNVIDYIEKVYNILKPGGYWINFGPLLYHFADLREEVSIELTYEEVKDVILNKFKFILVKENMAIKSTYVNNPRSMLSMVYECAFFVVQKPFVEE
ncbi:carnosine N-methyltransferase-like [Hydractinia symbiolongicarpus]|uniref:carnosine N-methyltransferase-like n=1 Tax=Hydractinia symbiolongicarpus TaxID=13093 RepID=UPI00254F1E9B|nr:carnosine N-methyltransferase-like [Hydractinia symbiolongicarpus]